MEFQINHVLLHYYPTQHFSIIMTLLCTSHKSTSLITLLNRDHGGDAGTVHTYLHLCGSVYVYQGVLPAHLGVLLLDSPLLGNYSPPSVNPSLVLPVDSNKAMISVSLEYLFVHRILWRHSDTRQGAEDPYQEALCVYHLI
jgi:hypothetical protein